MAEKHVFSRKNIFFVELKIPMKISYAGKKKLGRLVKIWDF